MTNNSVGGIFFRCSRDRVSRWPSARFVVVSVE